MVGTVEQRWREALLVATVGDLADELVDEVSPVGEDQHAAGARGVDEAHRGDRLAGSGRVLEPEPPARAGVLGCLGDHLGVGLLGLVPILWLLVGLERVILELGLAVGGRRCVARLRGGLGRPVATVAPRLALGALELAGDCGEGPGQRIDLVVVELGAVEQHRPLVPEQPLESEQQGVVAPPLEGRRVGAGVELLERCIHGAAASGPRRQVGARLALEQDRLTGELPHPVEVGLAQLDSRASGNVGGIGHGKRGNRPRARADPGCGQRAK